MSNYLTPGVYVEDINQIVQMPTGSVPAVAFIGVAESGPVGVPVSITSWNMYLSTFAGGRDTAFLTNSYLAYAVYGFFQNGGKVCYVLRVSDGTVDTTTGEVTFKATSAQVKAPEEFSGFTGVFEAKYEGAAGNNITIFCPKDGVNETLNTFALQVKLNGKVVESWGNLKAGVNVGGCYADVINAESQFIKVTDITYTAPLSIMKGSDVTLSFEGGTDGLSEDGSPVPNTIYEASLPLLDYYDIIRLMCIPGANNALQKSLAEYCTEKEYRIAICEGAEITTKSELTALRESLDGLNAILYGPWIRVTNPLSSSGALINVPACGHIAGTFARITSSRGFWKAPAGTEAVLRGAVDVVKIFTQEDTDILNPKGINALVTKSNYGVVIWGARSCNNEMAYASDLYTNITIKKNLYDLTQNYIFEPHDSTLWTKVKTICQDYLNNIYQQGGFFGDSADQAFYVKCDEELNPINVRNQGKLIIEVGYATKKPAEFIIMRISHELTTS